MTVVVDCLIPYAQSELMSEVHKVCVCVSFSLSVCLTVFVSVCLSVCLCLSD
jgi:hypothetical protein